MHYTALHDPQFERVTCSGPLVACLFLHLALGPISSSFLNTGSVPSADRHALDSFFKYLPLTCVCLSLHIDCNIFLLPFAANLEQTAEHVNFVSTSSPFFSGPQSQSNQSSSPLLSNLIALLLSLFQSGSYSAHHGFQSL